MNRKWLAVIAKAAISVLLIWYLFDRVDVTKVMARARTLDLGEAALAIAVLLVQTGFVTARWWLVAHIMKASLAFGAALRILWVGLFFNQTLPSAVGGDAIRVWLVTREGTPLGKAVNLVLCDRVFALIVLVGIIGLTLPIVYARIDDEATRTTLSALVGVGAAGIAAFLLIGERIADLLQRWRFTKPFAALARDFRQLFIQPAWTLALIALSSTIHLLTIATVLLIGWGLDLPITFADALIVVPTVLMVTTLPISVAGWGVREGAMVAGFGFLGIAADGVLALSVLFGLATILVALPGGLLWLVGRPRDQRPPDIQGLTP
jgi:glycosyltransferase 2 family protein